MKKAKKIFTKFICLFIWQPQARRNVRSFITNFEFISYLRFIASRVRPNTVLLIEPNNTHGEVAGGILPLFQKLGMNVDILMNECPLSERPFCRQDMRNTRVFKIGMRGLNLFFDNPKCDKYRAVFLMTSACYWAQKPAGGYTSSLQFFTRQLPRMHVIEHDLGDVTEFGEENMLNTGRLITLGKFDRGIFINPHMFGPVKKLPKHNPTHFIVVGGIEPQRKNFAMLIDAMQQLVRQHRDFMVTVIGRGKMSDIPAELHPHIQIMGRLDFPRMFDQIENADFFLTLLDPENPAHDRYITTGVTGSAQLIYSFAKVPVVHKKFAGFYRFDETNAIVYDGTLGDAMAHAIDIAPDKYIQMQTALTNTANAITTESIENLKGMLNVK